VRIRSALACLTIGAGALLLAAPAALAQPPSATTQAADNAPTASPTTKAPAQVDDKETRPMTPADRRAAAVAAGAPQVVKPRGAAETGGGGTDSSPDTSVLVLGGIALVVTGGVGTMAYRRRRGQSW
jgi:hypothetical protein